MARKTKTYVIMLSQAFPANHPRAGEPTFFYTKLRKVLKMPIEAPALPVDEPIRKIHTIRANYDLWEKRFDKIDKGEAELSIRVWEGKPYRSKQIEIARLDRSHGIGIQPVNFNLYNCDNGIIDWFIPNMSICGFDWFQGNAIAHNDGLSVKDWRNWFISYHTTYTMAIIHFTPFRY